MPNRIPIAEAKRVADNQKCKQVIIVAWDGQLTHIVTYGIDKEQCRQAALGGDKIAEFLGFKKV